MSDRFAFVKHGTADAPRLAFVRESSVKGKVVCWFEKSRTHAMVEAGVRGVVKCVKDAAAVIEEAGVRDSEEVGELARLLDAMTNIGRVALRCAMPPRSDSGQGCGGGEPPRSEAKKYAGTING